MKNVLNVTKALSDENRIRIIVSLNEGELCVCQVIELLKLAPSTVSKHISILKNANLVDSRKDGRWVYYKLPIKKTDKIKTILKWIRNHTKDSVRIQSDLKTLAKIKRNHLENSCKQTTK